MINGIQIVIMSALAILWVCSVFFIGMVVTILWARRLRHHYIAGLKVICMLYLIWLMGDVVALYTYGTASTLLRTMVLMLLAPPNDYHDLRAEVELEPSKSNYMFTVWLKYDTGYVLGIGDPEQRGGLVVPPDKMIGCRCSIKNASGRSLLTKQFSLEYTADGKGCLDFEYGTFAYELSRKHLVVELNLVGDLNEFCKSNPRAKIYIRAKPM